MTEAEIAEARRRFDIVYAEDNRQAYPLTREKVRWSFKDRGWSGADFAYQDGVERMRSRDKLAAAVRSEEPVIRIGDLTPGSITFISEDCWSVPQAVTAKHSGRRGNCPPSPLPVALPRALHYAHPIAVISDLHVPYHDEVFIDRMVDKALREGVKRFILAGDLTDNGQWNAKRGIGRQQERSWQKDIDLARSVMGYLCANFQASEEDKNIVMFGNHDEWITNMTKGQITADWLYAYLFPDMPVEWLTYHQATLSQQDGKFLIVHGEKFSHANPMGVVEQYALHRRMSVIVGHMHYAAQWQSGRYQLILNGGCFNQTKMSYIHKEPLPMRETQTGFTIVSEGRATLYAGRENNW